MLKIRHIVIALGMMMSSMTVSAAQLSLNIGFPNASIGINLSEYPELVVMPGYPVYYAPRLEANFFFYDGLYWIYQDDDWYASSWYNGPWGLVDREEVPLFVLRIPVRYYRLPPAYFIGWRLDAPPRWGDHWGRDWEQRRSGWNRWNRVEAHSPAPLPVYQRNYSGDRYPRQVEQQQELQKQHYRYQPRGPIVQQYQQEQPASGAPARQGRSQPERQMAPEERDSIQQRQQDAPVESRSQGRQRSGADVMRPQRERPEVQDSRQPAAPEMNRREQQPPRSQGREEKQQDKDAVRESKRKPGQDQERGRDRNE